MPETIELLKSLPRIPDAKYDRGRGCCDGTREEVVEEIIQWCKDFENKSKVLWLCGQAGTGKSTIAASIARILDELLWLGGSFFFSRDVDSRSTPDRVFSTVAFQMAFADPALAEGIYHSLKKDIDVGRSALYNQFHHLIRKPLQEAGNRDLRKPIIIILDALDECGTERERKELLSILFSELSDLPPFAKFIITSRPDVDIRITFHSMGISVHKLDLAVLPRASVDHDISKFILFRLTEIARYYERPLPPDWPSFGFHEALVQRAEGLFIWASTACNFIEDEDVNDPDTQLDLVVGKSDMTSSLYHPWTPLDSLYQKVLLQAVAAKAPSSHRKQLKEILGAIVLALNPLSAPSLCRLLSLNSDHLNSPGKVVTDRLRKLHSVLSVQATTSIHTLHPSFRDFLTDPNRCTDNTFYIDPQLHHSHLARRCLIHMRNSLCRDICRAGRVPRMNADILDLTSRLEEFIPEDVQYACQFWAVHLSQSSHDETELFDEAEKFLSEHFLHWIEVLSLTGLFDTALSSLLMAADWVQRPANMVRQVRNLSNLLQDTLRFVREYRIPIVASAAQIYISAGAFCPRSTRLFAVLSTQYQHTVQVVIGADENWPQCLAKMEGHRKSVAVMAMSRDGNRIVSGSSDGTVRVWDVETSAGLCLPTKNEQYTPIVSIAISPYGTYAMAATWDNKIYTWDIAHPVCSTPIKLSRKVVQITSEMTLAFCDDERRGLCGSFSCARTESGKPITKFFISPVELLSDSGTGHVITSFENPTCICTSSNGSDICTSITFSSDGTLVAVRAQKNTMQIRDTRTGFQICPILRGDIWRPAFSTSGSKMVSFSNHAIDIWDLKLGAITITLHINESDLYAVAFSPDESRIVLGHSQFRQHWLRIWDLKSSSPVGVPMEGHSESITGVLYSPDGNRIVSCSDDGTLRDWNANANEPVDDSHHHQSAVIHVAFSPDGSQFASCSDDGELLLRDTITGNVIASLGKLHVGCSFLKFSPDGKCIACIESDTVCHIWNLQTLAVIEPIGDTINITAGAFSPDGNYFGGIAELAGGCIWNLKTHSIILQSLQAENIPSVPSNGSSDRLFLDFSDWTKLITFSADGKLAIFATCKGLIRILDTETGVDIRSPIKAFADAVVFSLDSQRIVISEKFSTKILIWDWREGTIIALLDEHTSGVLSVTFSPDWTKIISRSAREQFVWDATTHVRISTNEFDPLHRRFDGSVSFLHLLDDGWVVDLGNQPIFWVPVEKRRAWDTHGSKVLLGGSKLTLLDISGMAV